MVSAHSSALVSPLCPTSTSKYDNLLYTDRLCPTLKIRKIARSKYSGGKHIPRFDHFCGWLNQAIGERNYRWFLLFLVVNVGMYGYATWVFAMILYGEIVEKKLLTATFVNAVTGEEVKADKTVVFHYLFARCVAGLFVFVVGYLR